MMKRLLLFVLAMLLLCAGAGAEQITRTLSPDLSDAPWYEGVVFALDLEEPEGFPQPDPLLSDDIRADRYGEAARAARRARHGKAGGRKLV